jgi:hypothetical protein
VIAADIVDDLENFQDMVRKNGVDGEWQKSLSDLQ